MKKTEDTNKNISNTDKKTIYEALNEFGVYLNLAGDAIEQAAKIYAEAVSHYGEAAVEVFHKRYPGITQVTWDRFIRIANGKLIPQVIMLSDRVARKYEVMPISQQRKQLGGKKSVKVVSRTGRVSETPLADLSSHEENTVFKPNGEVRTLEEQIAYHQQRMASATVSAYEVCGNILVVKRACKIGKDELVKILKDMK